MPLAIGLTMLRCGVMELDPEKAIIRIQTCLLGLMLCVQESKTVIYTPSRVDVDNVAVYFSIGVCSFWPSS